jgi:hypothetical protein
MKIIRETIDAITFKSNYDKLSDSQLFEKIYLDNDVLKKLKRSDVNFVFELIHPTNGFPMYSFVYNKGFMKGKVFCILLEHKVDEENWETKISEPFIKEGNEWVSGKFRTKKREEEFENFIKSGELWK